MKTVCIYPQYQCCGNKRCPLFVRCQKSPITARKGFTFGFFKARVSAQPKSAQEKKEHQKKYMFYNRLFGDTIEKRAAYNRKYYAAHREQILLSLRKPESYRLTKVQQAFCTGANCEHCPYPDCIVPEYESRKEYMDLYYSVFHDHLLQQKTLYRSAHREVLANNEKLRNYKKREYPIVLCTLSETTNSSLKEFEDTYGFLTPFSIGSAQYISFISADKTKSFRCKIAVASADLRYSDINSYTYTFSQ